MFKDPLPYLVLLGVTTLVVTGAAIRLRRSERRDGMQYRVLLVLFASALVWNVAALLDGIGFSPALSYQFNKLTYLGIPTAATAWLAFALAYSDRQEFLSDRVVALLAVEPILMNVAVWTNDVHQLIWRLDWSASPAVNVSHGPLFWVHVAYMYVITLAGVVVMADVVGRRQRVFQRQSVALALGAAVPLAGNVLYLAGLSPVDPTPVSFAVSGLIYLWAIERTGLGTVSPIARKTVIDTMGAGMLVLDEEDRLVDVNRQGRRLLGADPDEEIVGRPVTSLLGDRGDVLDRFDGVVQGRETVAVDTENGRRHYEIELSPVTDDEERIGRLFLVQDVTDRLERQRDLERKNEQLEEFASVVSHDLRNPLGVAAGYVDLIQDTTEDEEIGEYATKAADSHERMETLVEDILSMARETDAVEEPVPVTVGGVARDAWETVEGASMTLSVTPAAESAAILADPDRLRRAFENLFRNAREHAGEAVTVTVGCETDDESPFVDPSARTIYVADDGPGIPPEERDSALERGYTTNRHGTGFGLPIVRRIAQAHGWSLRIDEGESGGAKIVFEGVAMPQGVAPGEGGA